MVPGQNGDKPKRRKSKWRNLNGDNPKRRQDKGNITKTATKNKGQSNVSRKLLIITSPESTSALQLGPLLNGSKQTSKKLCEATTTPLHTSGNIKRLCRFFTTRRYASVVYVVVVCLSLCVSVCHTPVLIACSKCVRICLRHSCKNVLFFLFFNKNMFYVFFNF